MENFGHYGHRNLRLRPLSTVRVSWGQAHINAWGWDADPHDTINIALQASFRCHLAWVFGGRRGVIFTSCLVILTG